MLDCLSVLLNIISLGPCNVGHVQKPMEHQATHIKPLLKNTRRVEDALVGTEAIPKCDITQRLTLLFSKDSARQGSDKRAMTQDCISPFASKACKWQDSEAHQAGFIGPMNLIRVSEMVGYDAEHQLRPSVAARMEQFLGNLYFPVFLVVSRALSGWFLKFEAYWKPLSFAPIPQKNPYGIEKSFPSLSTIMVLSWVEAVECFPVFSK